MDSVEIAVPIYNGSPFLADAIRSLLAQTYSEFSLLCLDDASTDDSLKIAWSFDDPRLRVVQNERRLGLAGNWNRAFQLTTAEYLVIAHQDDVYDSNYLAATLALISARPRAFIAHTGASYISESGMDLDSAGWRFKQAFWPREEPYERAPADELRVLQGGNYIICPSVIYRMSAVARIGPFNDRLRFVTDWEYWIRGLRAGFTIAGTHARLVSWRRHASTATTQAETSLRRYDEEIGLLDWIGRECALPPRFEAVEHTMLSDFASRLAQGDRAGATVLRDYARTQPALARTARTIMDLGLLGGRMGGRMLELARDLYARMASLRRRK